MITERQVVQALPKRGFLRDYVQFAAQSCDCHASFHVLGGLTLLSMTVPPDFYFPIGVGRVRANIYGLIVGDSSESRKTAGVDIAMQMLDEAIPETKMKTPGSPAALQDQIIDQGQQTLFYPEFGAFLAETVRGQMMPIRQILTSVYDCTPVSRETVTGRSKNRKTVQPNPRLSLLGACAPGFLESLTMSQDWTEGFLARFITMYGKREREMHAPPTNRIRFADLVSRLKSYREPWVQMQTPPQECLGFSPEALQKWVQWCNKLRPLVERAPALVRAAVSRAQGHARKIAALLEWDLGEPRRQEGNWSVGVEALTSAISIASLHVVSVEELSRSLARDEAMQVRRRVLNAVKEEPTSFGAITEEAEITARRGREFIETLLWEKKIERVPDPFGGKDIYYRRLEPDDRPPFDLEGIDSVNNDNVVPLKRNQG